MIILPSQNISFIFCVIKHDSLTPFWIVLGQIYIDMFVEYQICKKNSSIQNCRLPQTSCTKTKTKHKNRGNKNVKAFTIHSVILLRILRLATFVQQLNGRFWSNALNMHTFMLRGSKSVRIGILFSDSRHFLF